MKRKKKNKPNEPKVIVQPHRKPIVLSYVEMKDLLTNIPVDRDKLFLMIMYANGMRVKEACMIKLNDITWDDEFLYINQPVLKKRKKSYIPTRAPPIDRKKEAWLSEAIIDIVKKPKEGYLIQLMEARENGEKLDNKVGLAWGYSKRKAQQTADKYAGTISHAFRHARVTHCLTEMHMSLRMLADFFGVSGASLGDWSVRYGHLVVDDMKEHLRSVRRNLIENCKYCNGTGWVSSKDNLPGHCSVCEGTGKVKPKPI
jgi:integrase